MAKSQNNVVTHGLSGKIGDMLIFRQQGGKTIVSTKSNKPRKQSEKQKEHQKRFQRATLYAKAAQATEEYLTAAASKGKTPYLVAVADFFNAPDIDQIDVSAYTGNPGDMIRIRVTDDFSVKSVTIRISNNDGSLVEEGAAQPDALGIEWIYTAAATNGNLSGDKIEVFASDTPGNITSDALML